MRDTEFSLTDMLGNYWANRVNHRSPWKVMEVSIRRDMYGVNLTASYTAVMYHKVHCTEIAACNKDTPEGRAKLLDLMVRKAGDAMDLLLPRPELPKLPIRPSPNKIPPQKVPALTLAKAITFRAEMIRRECMEHLMLAAQEPTRYPLRYPWKIEP